MKRSLLWIAGAFLVLFGGISLVRGLRSGEEDSSDASGREHVRRFWEAYHSATKARTERDFSRSESLYREALETDPRHEDSLFYLAISLEESGKYAEAAQVLRRLTTVNPESGRAWSQLGAVLVRKSPGAVFDPEGARVALAQSQEINPEHSGPFLGQGRLALELDDLAEAGRRFRIASDMGSPEGAFLSGLVAYLEGDDGSAARFFSRVLDVSAREAAIAGRGATSEGDVEADLGATLTPLESARIRALVFLYWTSRRMGGYPEDVPDSRRISLPRVDRRLPVRVESGEIGKTTESELDFEYEGTLVDAAVADFDSDSLEDVFLLGWKAPGRLLRKTGSSFEDVTERVGLAGVGGDGLSAVFFDYDRDSDPDLLVTSHAPLALSLQRLLHPEKRARARTPRLFRNDEGRRFTEVTGEAGLDRHYGVVQALPSDVDGDGFVDLVFAMGGFEASHLESSLVLRNRGGKDFEEWAYLPSVDEPIRAAGVRMESGEIVLRRARP